MNKLLILILVVLNIPLYGALASILFGKGGIRGAIRFLFIPDILSALKGEYWEDQWSQLMLTLWVVVSVFLVWSEYHFVKNKFPFLFQNIASVWP